MSNSDKAEGCDFMNIGFHMPTRVILADNCIDTYKEDLKGHGQKAIIVTGATSAKKSGALHDITQALEQLEISYCIFDKVMANPTITCVYEGAEFARKNQADFVIGIGGGSPMDAAKAIALLAVQEVKEEDLFSHQIEDRVLPILCVPTTAGTGSEVTPYAILTNDKKMTKTSIASPYIFPKIALLDAKYTYNLPMGITINTALDALSHAIEGILSVRSTSLSSGLAVESIKTLMQCISFLEYGKGIDTGNLIPHEIREMLLYGSMLAGMVITHTGTTAVHSMGYALTYFKNVDHGRSNGLLLPSFLRFTAKSNPEIVKKVMNAMGITSMDECEALFLGLIGEREQISEKEMERFASIAIQAKNVNNSIVAPTKEDIINIYTRSLKIF